MNRTPPLVALLILSGAALQAAQIPLAGTWQLQLDPKDEGVTGRLWEKPFNDAMQLPGTTALAGKGTPLNIPINLELKSEAHNIFREFGNHPSLVMLSLGNELDGDFNYLDACLAEYRRLEPQLLFTSTTFAFAPRGDMNRGRIAHYSIEVSQEGQKWLTWVKDGKFPDTADKQTVTFAQPVKAKFLRLTTVADHGDAKHAAIAELEPVAEEITPDVRDLGIVPGFNDQK